MRSSAFSRGGNTLKQQVYSALENVRGAKGAARFCGFTLVLLICLNAVMVLVPEQYVASAASFRIVRVFSVVSALIFLVEYGARVWVADMVRPQLPAGKARLRYVLSLMGLVDLLAFLPSLVALAFPLPAGVMSVVNLLRLVRLIKITRYMKGMQTIARVLERRKHEIVASFMVLGLLALTASVLMYEVESAVQPEKFDSVLTGMYWAITTMSSTGYGDLVPITAVGRLIGWLLMVLSIAFVAIPGGIFSAGFVEEFRLSHEDESNQ